MTASRSGSAGLRRIIQFNWPKLTLAAGLVLGALWLGHASASPVVEAGAALVAASTAYFLVASLVASWWVYDRSDLHGWRWLHPLLGAPGRPWALVHAGFDESGPGLPAALGVPTAVVDLTPWLAGSSASHRRARRRYPAPSTATSTATSATIPLGVPLCRAARALPLGSSSCDRILLVFSAHEVRSRAQREELFEELHRVLRPGGRVVLVEHLRDLPNLAVFGPGALHFQTRAEWARLARRSGFATVAEVAKTSFVRGIALCAC